LPLYRSACVAEGGGIGRKTLPFLCVQTQGHIDVHFRACGLLGLELITGFITSNRDLVHKVRPCRDIPETLRRAGNSLMSGRTYGRCFMRRLWQTMEEFKAQASSGEATRKACPVGLALIELARVLFDHVHAFHKDCMQRSCRRCTPALVVLNTNTVFVAADCCSDERKRIAAVMVLDELFNVCAVVYLSKVWPELAVAGTDAVRHPLS